MKDWFTHAMFIQFGWVLRQKWPTIKHYAGRVAERRKARPGSVVAGMFEPSSPGRPPGMFDPYRREET